MKIITDREPSEAECTTKAGIIVKEGQVWECYEKRFKLRRKLYVEQVALCQRNGYYDEVEVRAQMRNMETGVKTWVSVRLMFENSAGDGYTIKER